MSARRNRSHSRSGAAGERGGGGARRSDPASPPLRAPALRRSQRKSGSEPDAPPQPSTPAPWKTFSLKKIGPGPPAAKGSAPRTPEAPSPRIQKSIPAKRSAPQTPTERSESRIPAKRSAPQTPAERSASRIPAKRSAPQTPAERSESRIPAKRSAPQTPAERKAPQTPAERSAPQTPAERSASRIPAKRSAPQTPAERKAPQTPAERSAPQTPAERSESRIPAKRSAPQTPAGKSAPGAPTDKGAPSSRAKRSSPQIPAERSAPRTPEAPSPRIQKSIPAKRSAPQTPVERSAPQTPAGKSAPGAPTDKGVPGSRAKRSSPQIPAERSEPRTPEAAPAVAGRAISVKKLVARTQESQSPSPRGGRSAAKKKASLSAEVTLSEKENSPPLQENVPLHKGGSSLATGPAPEVTPTVLGPLTPNAVARPPLMDARDLEMSRKVRRSYSRLDELGLGSTSTPNYQRRSFFGFERLLSGEELENVSPVVKESKHPAAAPSTEAWGPDSILPGIPMTKEKRRKRKVPEILKSELDEWAAAMNAQFEAAEKFDLLVE
ncbi:sororin [Sminthopsis crassicaudata]|uniref:sororin n=1 Tax=Sminthopsis crassicaudata TaxID=9301 RepID=UPI003D681E67